MKISEILFEGPYSHDGDFTPSIRMDSYPSLEGLERENFYLGLLEKDGEQYRFWLSKTKGKAEVTVDGVNDIGQPRQLVATNMRFHRHPAGLPVKNELQVHTVYTHPDFRNRQLAMVLYVVLCRYGYTVVSDFEHYDGGKALWKKMATEADARRFKVRIWSDADDDWFRADDGSILEYNGANLSDDEVWHDLDGKMLPTTLMVLSHD